MRSRIPRWWSCLRDGGRSCRQFLRISSQRTSISSSWPSARAFFGQRSPPGSRRLPTRGGSRAASGRQSASFASLLGERSLGRKSTRRTHVPSGQVANRMRVWKNLCLTRPSARAGSEEWVDRGADDAFLLLKVAVERTEGPSSLNFEISLPACVRSR